MAASEAASLFVHDVGVDPDKGYGWLRARSVEPQGWRASHQRDPLVHEAVGLVCAEMSII